VDGVALHRGGAHVPIVANDDVAREDAETPGDRGLSRESSASGCQDVGVEDGEGEGFRELACEEGDVARGVGRMFHLACE